MKIDQVLIWAAVFIICTLAIAFLVTDFVRPSFRMIIAGILIAPALLLGIRAIIGLNKKTKK